ncbi:MAG: hypothetical protein ACYC6P_10000 [Ignavibacteriaceae bacterium]
MNKYVSYELADYMAFSLDKSFEKLVHENLSEREFQITILLALLRFEILS